MDTTSENCSRTQLNVSFRKSEPAFTVEAITACPGMPSSHLQLVTPHLENWPSSGASRGIKGLDSG